MYEVKDIASMAHRLRQETEHEAYMSYTAGRYTLDIKIVSGDREAWKQFIFGKYEYYTIDKAGAVLEALLEDKGV